MKREKMGRSNAARGTQPDVVVCAWCQRGSGAEVAVRAPHETDWVVVARDDVRAFAKAGNVSHGVCPACRASVLESWRT